MLVLLKVTAFHVWVWKFELAPLVRSCSENAFPNIGENHRWAGPGIVWFQFNSTTRCLITSHINSQCNRTAVLSVCVSVSTKLQAALWERSGLYFPDFPHFSQYVSTLFAWPESFPIKLPGKRSFLVLWFSFPVPKSDSQIPRWNHPILGEKAKLHLKHTEVTMGVLFSLTSLNKLLLSHICSRNYYLCA